MMVRFVPSLDTPWFGGDTGPTATVIADEDGNLALRAARLDGVGNRVVEWFTLVPETPIAFESDAWHRLTIEVLRDADGFHHYCRVLLDGAVLEHATYGHAVPGDAGTGGAWFLLTRDEVNPVPSIGFQGTGDIDDLVVANSSPGSSEPRVELSAPTRAPAVPVVGETVEVGVTARAYGGASITDLHVYYRSGDEGAFSALVMNHVGDGRYSALLPALPVGNVAYYFACSYVTDGVRNVTYPDEGYLGYSLGGSPSQARTQDFEAPEWPSHPASTFTHTDGWSVHRAYAGSPAGWDRRAAFLENEADAFVQSPLIASGIGSVYFWTRNLSDDPVSYRVDVSTNGADWEVAGSGVSPGNASQGYWHRITINRRDTVAMRILRTSVDPDATTRLGIDDITLSPPPAAVVLTERLFQPGYPSQADEVQVRVAVNDVDAALPTSERQLTVFYRWQEGAWSAAPMVPLTADLYEGTIPAHAPGRVEYYFRCDFQGYHFQHPEFPADAENQSPAYLIAKGEDNYRNYEIRRYRSDVQVMRILAAPPSVTVDMELVGDHEWQGLTLVAGITNLAWSFVGVAGYTDGVTDYDPAPWVWGDDDQQFPFPPVAGYAERDATHAIRTELQYDGFLLIRMNRQTGSYIAKRAVYQNFDVWTASQTEFESSLGMHAAQTFRQEFGSGTWTFDAYAPPEYRSEPVDTTTPSDFVRSAPALTDNGWAYDQARVVAERKVYDADLATFVNRRAVELDGGIARGRVWNTYVSKTKGIENLAFHARLSLNDRYFTYFKGPTKDGASPFDVSVDWPKNYHVMALLRARTLSPGLGSLSVLTWISPGQMNGSGETSYYEVRLSQGDPDTVAANKRMNLQVFRWREGVATQIGDTRTLQGVGTNYDVASTKALRVEMPSTGGSIIVRVGLTGVEGSYGWTQTFTDTAPLTTFGTFGFLSFDAQMEVFKVKVFKGADTVNVLPAENWDPAQGMTSANWYMGGKRMSTDQEDRWRISGTSLIRDLPSQTLGIYLAPMPDGVSMLPDFTELIQVATPNVSTLAYQPFIIPVKRWNASFVLIKNEVTGEINAVVDEFALSPWRAVTRADVTAPGTIEEVGGVPCHQWTTVAHQDAWALLPTNAGWLVMEGRVNMSAGSMGGEVQFDRSRANTNLVQALVSPYLTNNIGSITFDWRASGVGDVVFSVDHTDASDESTWVSVMMVTNAASSGSSHVPIRTGFPGRIRIRVCEGTRTSGTLKLDNLIVRDNPSADETSWIAYNALITAAQTARAFEPTRPDAQTAYLNNSPTDGVPVHEALDEHLAFIQTPKVGTGVGEIAFWYHIWDTAGGPGMISLQVAPSADTPDGEWKVLTNIVVNSTQTEYVYFSDDTIYEPDNKVLRLYCLDMGNRVCIDNVLITEPARAGFEFGKITLLPSQPLVGQTPGIEVEIGRTSMNPSNIRVFVSYYVGTNVWGYDNWMRDDLALTIELQAVSPRIYRTPEAMALPAAVIDDVVQYVIWGMHSDNADPIFQRTSSFENPAWYHPVDLNEHPVLKAQGWSPYYFVYSCPPQSVWINEVCYRTRLQEDDSEYVEIIGRANTSLENWKIEMLDTNNVIWRQSAIPSEFRLADTFNGWGFFVWGDAAVPNVSLLIPGSAPGTSPDVLADGGLRLVRSNGAWEDRVAWGSGTLSTLVAHHGYPFAGVKASLQSLSLATGGEDQPGDSSASFIWDIAPPTPGQVNQFQVLSEWVTASFMIYSAIGLNGTHNQETSPIKQIAIQAGESTGIVYRASDWYRIDTFVVNGAPVDSALGRHVYTQAFVNVMSDYSTSVTFAQAPEVEKVLGVPCEWARTYYSTEAEALADVDIVTAYLLDLDPGIKYAIRFEVAEVTVDSEVRVTVRLTDGESPLATTINGCLKLLGKENLDDSDWVEIAEAKVSGADFGSDGTCCLTPFVTDRYKFFRAVIE